MTIAVSGTTETVTDTIGRVTTSQFDSYGELLQLQTPDPARAPVVLTMSGDHVASYSDGAGTWLYTFQNKIPGGGQEPVFSDFTITDPNGLVTTGRTNIRTNHLMHITRPGGRRTDLAWDGYRLTRVTEPEGNSTQYVYDLRGNVAEVRRRAKPGSGLADIIQTAVYPTSCTATTRLTCNQPTSITDAQGATTDFTYSTAHGGLLTMTRPAPTPGAARPQTRYTWEQRYAWYKQNGSSAITQAPSPVWVQTGSSQCMTGATC